VPPGGTRYSTAHCSGANDGKHFRRQSAHP
jgi:hypothetical protein